MKVQLCTATNLEKRSYKRLALVRTEIFNDLVEVPDRGLEDGLPLKTCASKFTTWFTSGAFCGPRRETFDKKRLAIMNMLGNYYRQGRQSYRINVAFKPDG